MSETKLKAEFQYYLDNQVSLAVKYEGKVLVIKNQEVIGVYESEKDAINSTTLDHELGTFLIQKCSSDPDSVIWTFHSRVRRPVAEF